MDLDEAKSTLNVLRGTCSLRIPKSNSTFHKLKTSKTFTTIQSPFIYPIVASCLIFQIRSRRFLFCNFPNGMGSLRPIMLIRLAPDKDIPSSLSYKTEHTFGGHRGIILKSRGRESPIHKSVSICVFPLYADNLQAGLSLITPIVLPMFRRKFR